MQAPTTRALLACLLHFSWPLHLGSTDTHASLGGRLPGLDDLDKFDEMAACVPLDGSRVNGTFFPPGDNTYTLI